MKIQAEKQPLVEIAQSVLRVVSPRATLPVLGGVRITAQGETVEFAATDLEIFVRTSGDFSVEEPGTVVVPGRLLGEILRSVPAGKVTISGGDSDVRITSGRSDFSLRGFAVADFPNPPEVTGGQAAIVKAEELARALNRVVKAASGDEARPVLTGVLWEVEGGSLRLVATDSYRLAVSELVVKEGPTEARAIMPGRALGELARTLAGDEGAVEVLLGENQAAFAAGRTKIVTRLIEGEFPNWRHLIPEGYRSHLTVNKESFSAAVARVGLVAQTNTPVKFHLGDEIQLTASESGVAEAAEVIEDASYEGEPMVIAFNPRFFSDGLDGIEGDSASLDVTDPTKPAVLRVAERDDFTYLLMPVRLPG